MTDKKGDERGEQDENKRLTYCYLCSIRAHVHKKTVPVPVEKRRYLRPYLNPFELERRLERQSRQLIPKIKYKFLIQTGAETNSGTTANVKPTLFYYSHSILLLNYSKCLKVWFKLYGSAGVWETTQFPSTAKFTTGSQVEMVLDGPLIGDLRKIRVWVFKNLSILKSILNNKCELTFCKWKILFEQFKWVKIVQSLSQIIIEYFWIFLFKLEFLI